MIDVSHYGRDPIESFKAIKKELCFFNSALLDRKQVIAASKIDVLSDPSKVSRLEEMCRRENLPLLCISAVTGQGIKELIGILGSILEV